MRHVPPGMRQAVILRAGNRCEYCGLAQDGQAATFHIDHILPVVAGGETSPANLALACVSCSLRKGARQFAVDPATGAQAPLFNPRRDRWPEHFAWTDTTILGLTPCGRATGELLKLNRPLILAIRAEEKRFHRHPPPRI